jgi:hypothetical protein
MSSIYFPIKTCISYFYSCPFFFITKPLLYSHVARAMLLSSNTDFTCRNQWKRAASGGLVKQLTRRNIKADYIVLPWQMCGYCSVWL